MALFQSPFCSTFPNQDPFAQIGSGAGAFSEAPRRPAAQPTGRDSSTCTQVVWIFFWLLVLVLIAYPLALIAGLLYAILHPLDLLASLKPVIDFLNALLNYPRTCLRNMLDAKQLIVM